MKPKRVMIVEDNAAVGIDIKRSLEKLGYDVPGIITSGEKAVVKVNELKPDVILMDIKLSAELNGIQAAQQIKKDHDIPVIYLTAHSEDYLIQQAKESKPFGFLIKPFQERLLYSTIEIALYMHKLEQELVSRNKRLENEVHDRIQAETKLKQYQQKLEQMVSERTSTLTSTINQLKQEIDKRCEIEDSLRIMHRAIESSTSAVAISDLDGIILYVNPIFVKLWDYDSETDIIGKQAFAYLTDPENVEIIIKALRNHGSWTGELVAKKKDGRQFHIHVSASMVHDEHHHPTNMTASIIDITELKTMEQQIKSSLKEKEILLREIHHRVKNNMQTIAGLITIQSNKVIDSISTQILQDVNERIHAMSVIHEKLYQSKNLADIELSVFITEIIGDLFMVYGIKSSKISLKIEIDNSSFALDTVFPLGLIINELVTNSLKYAFPANRIGELKITLFSTPKETSLIIKDNGIGMALDEFDKPKSLGLQLVKGWVQQLNGQIEIVSIDGTEFSIRF